jgi:hypothetical protein
LTIAACYLSAEGVVFGADSTTTMFVRNPDPNAGGAEHHYNFAQKIFQIGNESCLGIATWGLGNLAATSYRTLIARFADDLQANPQTTMASIADRWNALFWSAFSTEYAHVLQRAHQLSGQATRTPAEDDELAFWQQSYSGGFCLGGCCLPDRNPQAFEITYSPAFTGPQQPQPLAIGSAKFWGCPNLIHRLIYGVDFSILDAISRSGKWTGTPDELIALVLPHRLAQPFDLPIREAIDWVHSSIYTTIQAMKFSHLAPVCGGPVELAVVTTDRPFRWVRHKRLDAPLRQGGSSDGYGG